MGIRVNFTDTEKYGKSSLGLDPLPTGKYRVAITDAELRDSQSSEWQYVNFEFTVQEGKYEGRRVWTNATLAPHALWTIKGLLEAVGYETTGGEFDIELDDLMNRELLVKVNFLKAGKVKQKDGSERDLDDRNEVKRFYKLDSEAAKTGGSLLP
jgi:Protein of unknown function (DUF669)